MAGPAKSAGRGRLRPRALAIAAVIVALAAFAGANAHLIYVSFASPPACVPHLKAPDGSGSSFRAASSAC